MLKFGTGRITTVDGLASEACRQTRTALLTDADRAEIVAEGEETQTEEE